MAEIQHVKDFVPADPERMKCSSCPRITKNGALLCPNCQEDVRKSLIYVLKHDPDGAVVDRARALQRKREADAQNRNT